MNNMQISQRLKHLSEMMSLLGEHPSEIRSLEKVVLIMKTHPEEMGVLIDEDRLKNVDGIDESLAKIILHYTKSGSSTFEIKLTERLPRGLPDLLQLPGLNLKKVHLLWKQHDIENIDQLNQACQSGQLSGMKGFGKSLEQNLLSAIGYKRKHSKDFHLNIALDVAQKWTLKLEALDSIGKLELSGQLRRGNELIHTIEFVVEARSSDLRAELESTYSIEVSDATPLIITDLSGLSIMLWACSAKEFPTCQLIRTAGEVYLKQIDAKLAKQGLSRSGLRIENLLVNESSERAVCESIGIQWLEPELRDAFDQFPEDRELIETKNVRGIFHAHSTWSDGRNTLEEMVASARALGYEYLGMSEHSQAAYYANGLGADRVKAQWDRIDKLNEELPGFHIFKGIEADILKDGRLDYEEELLAGFDFVIASIHSHFHLDSKQQTDRIVRALQSPFTTMLGHPTGRMLLSREGYAPDLPGIIEVASEYGKIIEINSTPKRLDLDWRYLKFAASLGVLISINPDAHSVEGLNTIPLGVMMARKGGLTASDVVNTMGLAEMKKFLAQRRSN